MQCLGLKATWDCQRLFFAARQDRLKIGAGFDGNGFTACHSPLQPLARQHFYQSDHSQQAHHIMVGRTGLRNHES